MTSDWVDLQFPQRHIRNNGKQGKDFPGVFSGWDFVHSLSRVWVQSLVQELRSHHPCGVVGGIKKKQWMRLWRRPEWSFPRAGMRRESRGDGETPSTRVCGASGEVGTHLICQGPGLRAGRKADPLSAISFVTRAGLRGCDVSELGRPLRAQLMEVAVPREQHLCA